MKRQIKFLKENYLLAIGFSLMFLSSLTGVIDMAMEKKDLIWQWRRRTFSGI